MGFRPHHCTYTLRNGTAFYDIIASVDPFRRYIRNTVALLIFGSAILLQSCGGTSAAPEEEVNLSEMMTQESEGLTINYSENGNLSYSFTTPLLERYEFAREPYMEFRRGIEIETYNDSTHRVESTLTANYAIFLEKKKLWEAKGNVIARRGDEMTLETEQLFWDQVSKRIYSNVDSKVTQGRDVIIGEGFESDERFEDFTFRKPKGRVSVDVAPTEPASEGDSTLNGTTLQPAQQSYPVIQQGEAVAHPKNSK